MVHLLFYTRQLFKVTMYIMDFTRIGELDKQSYVTIYLNWRERIIITWAMPPRHPYPFSQIRYTILSIILE